MEQEACVVGCHLQATTASLNPGEANLKLSDKKEPKGAIGVIQHVAFSLANHVGRMIRITWSWASSSHHQIESPENKVQGKEHILRFHIFKN